MKVIILCGGQGTRLREETEYKPKPMVEIGGKPILWHIMKIYAHYGYKDFVLALGYKGDIIRNYFLNYYTYNNDFTVHLGNEEKIVVHNNHDERDWKVTLAETGDESMTGYRVKLAAKYLEGDNFMLTYGDAVADVNIAELVKFHNKQNTIGTVTGVYPPSRFGDLAVNDNLVEKFKQKQKDVVNQAPINGGFFVFKKEFIDLLPDDPNADLEGEAMQKITNDKQLSVFKHTGFWQPMDTYREYELLNKMWKENPQWKVWE
ncbi:MAG: glucose-1-phosphate cytidylyltransferase [Ignavibacteria bacterium RIFOXYB2_FULL_35_12]|nr:MAG: glucose-1-phosphate cytidylyltransferase [Ignavibacteria bacterium GWF2_35_20]OGU79209.1 MAG: glucose-1-phosphate cytidylyltransferase [Ignavibacteria bacterium RIFOXYA2_FULL_35_9]OGU85776.1 MAG: glucose-1-phosphate cytidylyltransferase [Ignavibacteria bacterium RIFOXYA12_FULL_35_25]OGU93141.1 MAG: glucose-1-phosphate cytidylyltransferase [Ignavibacteria bacterium RIFOXYB12_FULL_35_14]OGU98297.1 MAG: glucose-1-phosphate cytidylyltransferase [Ignavibacteria bacterium RIFOXYC2_FULL_35_16]